MLYAATDAWACIRIYQTLAEMEETGEYEVVRENQEPKENEVKS